MIKDFHSRNFEHLRRIYTFGVTSLCTCEPFGPARLCLFRHEDHKGTCAYERSVNLAAAETRGRCARPVSRYTGQVCPARVPKYRVDVPGQRAETQGRYAWQECRTRPAGRMSRKQCGCMLKLWSHTRSLKHTINSIREFKDDYDTIVSSLQVQFEAMPWATPDEGIDLLFDYWRKHRQSYVNIESKEQKDNLTKILRILTKTLILYCQANVHIC